MDYAAVIDGVFSEMKYVKADESSNEIDDVLMKVKNNPEFANYLGTVILLSAQMLSVEKLPDATFMHGMAFGMHLQKKIDDLKQLEKL